MNEVSYNIKEWDRYARSHASVLTSFQLDLFREAAIHLRGDVVDCGCGSARLAPLLATNHSIDSYTGVDYAPEMVSIARWVVEQLVKPSFSIIGSKIENVDQHFTSAVSIHSYYSWSNPTEVLEHIYDILIPGSPFVLATPNKNLDMNRLLQESEKELIAHPYFNDFRQSNLKFAENPGANFIPMSELVSQTQKVGFSIAECHQRHYLGGVNFLVLTK